MSPQNLTERLAPSSVPLHPAFLVGLGAVLLICCWVTYASGEIKGANRAELLLLSSLFGVLIFFGYWQMVH